MLKKCQMCGELFHAQRSTAKYCSTKCRVAAHRSQVVPIVPDEAPVIGRRTQSVLEDVAMLNREAHQIGSDYIRLVNAVPMQLQAGCERIGNSIIAALEREGW